MDARILLAAGLALFPQEAVRKDTVELKVAGVPTADRANLRLEGRAPTLRDGTCLSVLLLRIEERARDGVLAAGTDLTHSELVKVKDGKFAYDGLPDSPPGVYRAVVRLMEEMQGVRSLQRLKEAGTAMPQEWTLDISAWGDGLAGRMSAALPRIDELGDEARKLAGEFKEASARRDLWVRKIKDLEDRTAGLLGKIRKPEVRNLYAAAARDIAEVMEAIQVYSRYMVFHEDGSLRGFRDYHPGPGGKEAAGQEFDWERLPGFLEKVSELAGREFALWAVKDLRRAGKVTDALAAALRERTGHPGLAPFADSLLRNDGLDDLEKLIRRKPR